MTRVYEIRDRSINPPFSDIVRTSQIVVPAKALIVSAIFMFLTFRCGILDRALSIWLFFAFVGIPGWFVVGWIRKLYPRVELLTGPEHARMEEQRRGKLNKIILLCILPLALSAIFELIKLVSKHL